MFCADYSPFVAIQNMAAFTMFIFPSTSEPCRHAKLVYLHHSSTMWHKSGHMDGAKKRRPSWLVKCNSTKLIIWLGSIIWRALGQDVDLLSPTGCVCEILKLYRATDGLQSVIVYLHGAAVRVWCSYDMVVFNTLAVSQRWTKAFAAELNNIIFRSMSA